jgi:hypothetical protein
MMDGYTEKEIRLKELPRTFGHSQRACRKNGADDTLDEKGDAPRKVRFNEGTKVICPLKCTLKNVQQQLMKLTTDEEYPTIFPVNSMHARAPR